MLLGTSEHSNSPTFISHERWACGVFVACGFPVLLETMFLDLTTVEMRLKMSERKLVRFLKPEFGQRGQVGTLGSQDVGHWFFGVATRDKGSCHSRSPKGRLCERNGASRPWALG